MHESVFEKQCIRALRELPKSYWPPKEDALSVRGSPDRVGCINGVYIALEFKKSAAEMNRQTGRIVLQRKVLKEIMAAGGNAFLVSPENWPEILRDIYILSGLKR